MFWTLSFPDAIGANEHPLGEGSSGMGAGRPDHNVSLSSSSDEEDDKSDGKSVSTCKDRDRDDARSEPTSESGLPSIDFSKLYDLVVGFHPEAKPVENAEPPPRCVTEGFFSEDPASKKSKRFTLFHRFHKVRKDLMDKMSKVVEEGRKKFASLLVKKRGSYKLAGEEWDGV